MRLYELDGVFGIAALAARRKVDELEVTRAYTRLGEALSLDWAQQQVARFVPADQWERLLTAGLARDFEQLRIDFLSRSRAARARQRRRRLDRAAAAAHRAVPQADRARAERRPCQRADARADRGPGPNSARALARCASRSWSRRRTITSIGPGPSIPQADAVRQMGATVDPVDWTSDADLRAYDLVLPLIAWGYHQHFAKWQALLDRFERDAVRVANPVPVLRWNGDKSYLAELHAKGVATVPPSRSKPSTMPRSKKPARSSAAQSWS